eukprot:8448198-Pyramimonas_sp.AAC.1
MEHLDASHSLQSAILSGDRQAVEAGARARAEQARDEQTTNLRNQGPTHVGRAQRGAEDAAAEAASTTTPWHADLRQLLNQAQGALPQGRLPPGSAREEHLDRLIRTLDARQRDEEGAGRGTMPAPEGRTSVNGDQA